MKLGKPTLGIVHLGRLVIGEGDLLVLWLFLSRFSADLAVIYTPYLPQGLLNTRVNIRKKKTHFSYDCLEQMKKVDQHNRFTNMLRHDHIHPQLLPIHLGFVRHPNCFFPLIFLVLSIMFMFDFIRGEDCGSVH